ncbi:tripartite tricarboxylate transporter substrate binding protein [Verticiella sediminum]|uniref:Tripartite tricarboxylate transporter substrate binding protein n=1 Tax=Verticiella sediminum TaxID=1247510 RepID=A0A556AVB7_9BURK|nr:tripartite tricarboxylate transporter substrate binding protein [Verticiella sediminum]TSH96899.1 tripartite tricarboxylate transporter substrate binding protein [Verticiella sediminum]
MLGSAFFRPLAGLCLASALALGSSAAQADYPEQPLVIVVPTPAGTVNDTVARLFGQELTAAWGQPVIVENRPGASSSIGTRQVARAAKDGYTALLTFTVHVQNPHLYPKLDYDAIEDFAPISKLAFSSTILAVTPDFPARTVKELVDKVRAAPGTYAYGSYGAGTTGHILGELLREQAGLDMSHIAYNGGTALATDMLGGHVTIGMIAVGTAMPHLKAGRIVPLAITGGQRSALLPDVPTFTEAGYQGFEPDAWMGLLFPAGVPRDRVQALSAKVAEIGQRPEIQRRLLDLNLDPVVSTPEAYAQTLREDYAKWGEIIRRAGIQGPQ